MRPALEYCSQVIAIVKPNLITLNRYPGRALESDSAPAQTRPCQEKQGLNHQPRPKTGTVGKLIRAGHTFLFLSSVLSVGIEGTAVRTPGALHGSCWSPSTTQKMSHDLPTGVSASFARVDQHTCTSLKHNIIGIVRQMKLNRV